MHKNHWAYFFLLLMLGQRSDGQILTLKGAIQTALNNYGTIKAKTNYVKASQASAKETSLEYLPDLNAGMQNVYGTANGQFGPLYALRGLSAASSGPIFLNQNWKAAFG